MTSTSENPVRTIPCPHCHKPSAWQNNPSRPFCSERCKLIDFGAWANEDYHIATQDTPSTITPEYDQD